MVLRKINVYSNRYLLNGVLYWTSWRLNADGTNLQTFVYAKL